jgi:hypothetical protein
MPEEYVGKRWGEVEIRWSEGVPTKRYGVRDGARKELGMRARTNNIKTGKRQEDTERKEKGNLRNREAICYNTIHVLFFSFNQWQLRAPVKNPAFIGHPQDELNCGAA